MDAGLVFKRGESNYMIRSKKRPGSSSRNNNSGSRKPGKDKRPKDQQSHFLYKLITLIMLVVLCPVGLIMLWPKRPIRWYPATKFGLSLVSIILCFALASTFLLYDFSDPTMQNLQARANAALGGAHDALAEFATEAGNNWRDVISNAPAIASVAGDQALQAVQEVIASATPEPTPTPVPTATPAPTPTPSPRPPSPPPPPAR